MPSESPRELESVLLKVLQRFNPGPDSPLSRVGAITPTHHCWFYCCIGTSGGRRPVAAAITVLRPLKNQNFWFIRLQVWNSELLYNCLLNALCRLEQQSMQKYILSEHEDLSLYGLN
jgi:hypothetical protein